MDLLLLGKFSNNIRFQTRHIRSVQLQNFRAWNLPKQLLRDKEYLEILTEYICVKEYLDARIQQSIDQGYIKNISKGCKGRCGGRPKLYFKANVR